MSRAIDPAHESKRKNLSMLGAVLLVIGILLGIVGVVRFSAPFRTSTKEFFDSPHEVMERDSSDGFSGVLFFGLGSLAAAVGLSLLVFAQRGRLARYAAGEVAPVVKDTFNYLAHESKEGLAEVGAALAGGPKAQAREVVKVKCRSCGYLESDDAKFCSSCAKPL